MRSGRSSKGRLKRAVTATLVGALAIAVTVAAPAEATWTSTYNLSATGWQGQDSPTVAVDRQGDSLLVWAACISGQSGCSFQVQARIRSAYGTMGAIKTLSSISTGSFWPKVASDDVGNSAVVWEQGGRVVGRRVSATGAVGSLRTLSATTATGPTVVVAPTGTALAVWTEIRNGSYYTVARYFYKDGSLGTPLTLGTGSADPPAAGIDRTGTAVVAWPASYTTVVAKRLRPGYQSPLRVIASAASTVRYAMVSVGDDRYGDAVVSFRRTRDGELPHVWARLWSHTNTLSGMLGVSPSTDNVSYYHALATDLAGDSVVVWSRWTSSTQTDVFGRRISRTGALGAVTRLGVGDRPAVTLDDVGNGLAVWHSPGPPYDATHVYARKVSTTGVFGATVTLSTNGRVARAASSPGGRFSVVWQQASYPYQIHARFGS
jgi:hypothetical protein